MENISFYENQFIKADELISSGNIVEAKEILEDLLADYPDYAKAHNHLGWIFYNKLSNFEKGMYHYKLAMKFDSKYSPPYLNYTYLLIDIGKFEEAKAHIEFSFETLENADYASFYSELGRIAELEQNYIKSLKFYKLAAKHALNQQFIDNMKIYSSRVINKMSFFERFRTLL
jgi:tetratricopeptide (TPR) repeat protein